jgi:hypothetical protein
LCAPSRHPVFDGRTRPAEAASRYAMLRGELFVCYQPSQGHRVLHWVVAGQSASHPQLSPRLPFLEAL